MSEIPYLAIDDYVADFAATPDGVFSGTGSVVVPFTMIDISGEPHFSYLGPDEHAFVSWLPLYDDYYWIFQCKGELVVDKEETHPGQINLYGQGQTLTKPGAFNFLYSTVKKPFRVDKISMTRHAFPFNYQSRQSRTGKIDGVNLIDLRDQDAMAAIDDQYGQFMDDVQTDDLIRLNLGEMLGVDGI